MIKFFTFIVLFFCSSILYAFDEVPEGWVYLGGDEKLDLYINRVFIGAGAKKSFFVMRDYKEPKVLKDYFNKSSNGIYRSKKEAYEASCSNFTYTPIGFTYYSGRLGGGDVVDFINFTDRTHEVSLPDTVAWMKLKFVCDFEYRSKFIKQQDEFNLKIKKRTAAHADYEYLFDILSAKEFSKNNRSEFILSKYSGPGPAGWSYLVVRFHSQNEILEVSSLFKCRSGVVFSYQISEKTYDLDGNVTNVVYETFSPSDLGDEVIVAQRHLYLYPPCGGKKKIM